MFPAGNKATRPSLVSHTKKAIYHHHYYLHHHITDIYSYYYFCCLSLIDITVINLCGCYAQTLNFQETYPPET